MSNPENQDDHGASQMAAGAAQFASGARRYLNERVVPAAHGIREQIAEHREAQPEAPVAAGIAAHAPKIIVALHLLMGLALFLPIYKSANWMSIRDSDGPYLLTIIIIGLALSATNLYLKSQIKALRISAGVAAAFVGVCGAISGFAVLVQVGASLGGLTMAFPGLVMAYVAVRMLIAKPTA